MRKILIFLSFISLFACQNIEKVEKPENLIPKDKMVNVLVEFSLLGAAKSYNLNQLKNSGIQPSKYLYAKYEIDSLQFVKSNEYYAHNLEDYEEIYNRVKDTLETMKTEYDSIVKNSRKKLDEISPVDTVATKRDTFETRRIRPNVKRRILQAEEVAD